MTTPTEAARVTANESKNMKTIEAIKAAQELAQSLAECEMLPGMLRRRLATVRRPSALRDALDDAACCDALDATQRVWALQASESLA